MLGSQCFLTNRERALGELACLRKLALRAQQATETVEAGRRIGMVGSQGFFANSKRALEERARCRKLAPIPQYASKIVETARRIRMVMSELLLAKANARSKSGRAAVRLRCARSRTARSFTLVAVSG